jgi:hypothetical protein
MAPLQIAELARLPPTLDRPTAGLILDRRL